MAFLVQSDEGDVVGANAYFTVSWLLGFYRERQLTLSTNDGQALQGAIIRVTDFMDSRYPYRGQIKNEGQSTQWPRIYAWRPPANGQVVAYEGIPDELKKAGALLVPEALLGPLVKNATQDDTGRAVDRRLERVGPITEETYYRRGGGGSLPVYTQAELVLAPLIQGAGRSGRAYR